MVRRLLIVVVLAIALAGCSSGVSDEEREAMLDTCRRTATGLPDFQSACFCAVDYMIEHDNGPNDFDEGDFHRAFRECGFTIP